MLLAVYSTNLKYLNHFLCYLWMQFLAGMAEKIVQGIEAAESDLSKEKEQKNQEEVSHYLLVCTLPRGMTLALLLVPLPGILAYVLYCAYL